MASQLSHRSKLPSWNRPGLCRKSGTDVRRLTRDQLSPLPPVISDSTHDGGEEGGTSSRAVQLEKNILFLNQQHQETLKQLHKEIERLKNENRELNFKLVMCQGGRNRPAGLDASISRGSRDNADSGAVNGELQKIFLEEKVRELRNSLATERTKSERLMRVIEKKVLERDKSSSSDLESGTSYGGGLYSGMSSASKPHNLEECETIIKQLRAKNEQQAHELHRIKADLRDVLYSHKWTPDAFLLARAYVSEDSNEQRTLPGIETQRTKQTLDRAYQRVKEEVTLPALRPKVSGLVAQRHRRTQAIRGRGGGTSRSFH